MPGQRIVDAWSTHRRYRGQNIVDIIGYIDDNHSIYAYSIGYNWYVAYNSRRPSRMKLVQGMYASLLPVSTEIRLVQGMTTLWALVYRALDRL